MVDRVFSRISSVTEGDLTGFDKEISGAAFLLVVKDFFSWAAESHTSISSIYVTSLAYQILQAKVGLVLFLTFVFSRYLLFLVLKRRC